VGGIVGRLLMVPLAYLAIDKAIENYQGFVHERPAVVYAGEIMKKVPSIRDFRAESAKRLILI